MRRKDKQLHDNADLVAIIQKAGVCRLAMVDNETPYVIPLNFGYHDNALYFHGAPKGYKMDILQKNPRVCFEFDIPGEVAASENPCGWSMNYQSVIGFGDAEFIEDLEEKRRGLAIIMGHYADNPVTFPENKLRATAVIKVAIESMTGKQSGG